MPIALISSAWIVSLRIGQIVADESAEQPTCRQVRSPLLGPGSGRRDRVTWYGLSAVAADRCPYRQNGRNRPRGAPAQGAYPLAKAGLVKKQAT